MEVIQTIQKEVFNKELRGKAVHYEGSDYYGNKIKGVFLVSDVQETVMRLRNYTGKTFTISISTVGELKVWEVSEE